MIFKTIAGFINIALMFLFYTMPVWVLALFVISFKNKKDNVIAVKNEEIKEDNIIIPANDEIRKEGLLHFIFNKNKIFWFKSLIILVLLSVGYYFALRSKCEGLGCLLSGIILAPFIFSFIILGSIILIKLISDVVGFYYPNQKKFHIPRSIINIVFIIFIVYVFGGPFIMGFVNKYFKQSNQINTNSSTNNETSLNSEINNELPPNFIKATFKIKNTNETFSYLENYVPNIIGFQDYDLNTVSNCISWNLQGDFLCKKVYFIENGLDKKKLAIYSEKSDAVVGKIYGTSFASEDTLVTQLPNPHKIDDAIVYKISYKFKGIDNSLQKTEYLCKNNNGEIICHDPSFKINDEVITFHTTGLGTNNLYGVYAADKVIEAELLNYQEFKDGKVKQGSVDSTPEFQLNPNSPQPCIPNTKNNMGADC